VFGTHNCLTHVSANVNAIILMETNICNKNKTKRKCGRPKLPSNIDTKLFTLDNKKKELYVYRQRWRITKAKVRFLL